ncbi:CvpA family protein [Mucilaginibacter auburnensis]|uniref:Colicin V production protein n=1 Tax=Mucilaginibacter auburnensis TaxID=1457233 RepID=A0A2H9VL15_9SPHI|nr:CvpA family protein [Mucilaginibacter auburnensis]PJJ79028.1 colicin V production protein [Mucilaginibacter auburnensis]
MNYIDFILILVIGLSVWFDIKRGFIVSSLYLLSWLSSLAAGFFLYAPFGSLLSPLGFWAHPFAFIIVIIIARFLFDNIITRILNNISDRVEAHPVNKTGGIITGIINGLIWAALLATFFLLAPLTKISRDTRDARFTESLISKVSWLEKKLSPIFGEALNRSLNKTTVEDEHGSVTLPFIVKHPTVRRDLEAEMLKLVNKERAANGLKPVEADEELTKVARKHSLDMFLRGYFSHYTPERKNPFDRMKADKIVFLTAGENLALSQTLDMAHSGLMKSPGHKANILNPTFGRLGIGILDGGIYGLMITQNFRN